MTSTVRRLVEEELERREGGSVDRERRRERKRRERGAARAAQQAAAQAEALSSWTKAEEEEVKRQRVEEALEGILGREEDQDWARISAKEALQVAGYKKRPKANKKEADKKKEKGAEASGSVFTDEDFEKWSKAYFIHSKLEDDK